MYEQQCVPTRLWPRLLASRPLAVKLTIGRSRSPPISEKTSWSLLVVYSVLTRVSLQSQPTLCCSWTRRNEVALHVCCPVLSVLAAFVYCDVYRFSEQMQRTQPSESGLLDCTASCADLLLLLARWTCVSRLVQEAIICIHSTFFFHPNEAIDKQHNAESCRHWTSALEYN